MLKKTKHVPNADQTYHVEHHTGHLANQSPSCTTKKPSI